MLVIFTDLDGTLLDSGTYSFEPARVALLAVARSGTPLVFCTSKTQPETEDWRKKTGNGHPFVVENGAAVFIPDGYFRAPIDFDRRTDGYGVIELGRPYSELRSFLVGAGGRLNALIRGFGDMTTEEIAERCAFSKTEAAAAARRGYDEPFVMGGGGEALGRLEEEAAAAGLKVVRGGRFFHLLGAGTGKGEALRILCELYTGEYGPVETAALGDSRNDGDMLAAADRAFLVRKKDGTHEDMDVPGLVLVNGKGPTGWAEAVIPMLSGKHSAD